MKKMLIGRRRLPVSRSQQDVRLSDKRGILPFTRSSFRDIPNDLYFH